MVQKMMKVLAGRIIFLKVFFCCIEKSFCKNSGSKLDNLHVRKVGKSKPNVSIIKLVEDVNIFDSKNQKTILKYYANNCEKKIVTEGDSIWLK